MRADGSRYIDTYLAGFLAERSGLEGDERDTCYTVIEKLSASLESGHSCLRLDTRERDVVAKSSVVSEGKDTPLVLLEDRLYLHRYYKYESVLAEKMIALAGCDHNPDGLEQRLDIYFGPDGDEPDRQKEAARLALEKSLCIISGGPGTGKTTTVVRILALLLELFGEDLKIGLAAPTGKAAMRLQESISGSVETLPDGSSVAHLIPNETTTLHRLLGVLPNSTRFRHNRENPLPVDVLVIDEASMVDVALMSKVVSALKPASRLILLGDKDQLASVESGAVLSDCISGLPRNTAVLTKSFRFDSGIAQVAGAINRGDADVCIGLLEGGEPANVGPMRESPVEYAGERYKEYLQVVAKIGATDAGQVFRQFEQFRVLCATRRGRRGVEGINLGVEGFLKRQGQNCIPGEWYPGRPVMVMQNDYNLGLFNGDVGICLAEPDGTLRVWFEPSKGTYRNFPPYRLPASETVYAMTIHKSQGSEFGEVLVVLPKTENRVLNRQLVYTAVTRARRQVQIAAEYPVLKEALTHSYTRSSGLSEMLKKEEAAGGRT